MTYLRIFNSRYCRPPRTGLSLLIYDCRNDIKPTPPHHPRPRHPLPFHSSFLCLRSTFTIAYSITTRRITLLAWPWTKYSVESIMPLAVTSPSPQDPPSNVVCLIIPTPRSQRLNAPPLNRRSTRRNGTKWRWRMIGRVVSAACSPVHPPTSTPRRHLPILTPPRLSPSRSSDPSYIPHPVSLPPEAFEAKKPKNSSTSLIRRVLFNCCMVTLLDLGELIIGHRPLRYRNWTRSSGNNVCTCCTRCAKTPKYYRLHISCSKILCVSVPFTVTADSQTLGQETTWDVVWPSKTSDSGQKTRLTRFSRYLNPHPPCILPRFNSKIAVLSGNHSLEASLSSQRLAIVGSFFLLRSLLLPHGLHLDAKRECDGIH